MNRQLHFSDAGIDRGSGGLDPVITATNLGTIPRQRNGEKTTFAPTQLPPSRPAAVKEKLNRRQLTFRCVRLVLSGVLLGGLALLTRELREQATSEQGYINGEIIAMRAPIAGQLRLAAVPGRTLAAGATLFTVENSRFGNAEVTSQLNWAAQAAEQLRAEAEEAALRVKQQEEICAIHRTLHAEKVLSRLALLEEEAKLGAARIALTNKQALSAQAQDRVGIIKRQVELQRVAAVKMPFAGVPWAVPAKNGAEVSHPRDGRGVGRSRTDLGGCLFSREARRQAGDRHGRAGALT